MSSRWTTLRSRLTGALIRPGDEQYAFARQVFFSEFDGAPAAVAYCENEADVLACVTFATEQGVPVAARSGGHSHAGFSVTDGLVIDVSRLDAIDLTPGSGGAGQPDVIIGPGVQGIDALATLAPHGLALVLPPGRGAVFVE